MKSRQNKGNNNNKSGESNVIRVSGAFARHRRISKRRQTRRNIGGLILYIRRACGENLVIRSIESGRAHGTAGGGHPK